jgi:hypothetical protein
LVPASHFERRGFTRATQHRQERAKKQFNPKICRKIGPEVRVSVKRP